MRDWFGRGLWVCSTSPRRARVIPLLGGVPRSGGVVSRAVRGRVSRPTSVSAKRPRPWAGQGFALPVIAKPPPHLRYVVGDMRRSNPGLT
ncbi:MAG: hypothetical protein LBM98_07765 [Oscillospiraceae bacterium]|nr:hypothetical protein [Oscillospiraceae bacterium]